VRPRTFVALDIEGVMHLAGTTKSSNFPLVTAQVSNPVQPTHASPGTFDGWVARVQ